MILAQYSTYYPEISKLKSKYFVITETSEGCTYTEFNEDGLVDVCIHADNENSDHILLIL